MKIENGKQYVEVILEESKSPSQFKGTWYFCQNGYQSTGVDISSEQFDMIRELVGNHKVVEFYENLRYKKPLDQEIEGA